MEINMGINRWILLETVVAENILEICPSVVL
jgi:hypothetical protein